MGPYHLEFLTLQTLLKILHTAIVVAGTIPTLVVLFVTTASTFSQLTSRPGDPLVIVIGGLGFGVIGLITFNYLISIWEDKP